MRTLTDNMCTLWESSCTKYSDAFVHHFIILSLKIDKCLLRLNIHCISWTNYMCKHVRQRAQYCIINTQTLFFQCTLKRTIWVYHRLIVWFSLLETYMCSSVVSLSYMSQSYPPAVSPKLRCMHSNSWWLPNFNIDVFQCMGIIWGVKNSCTIHVCSHWVDSELENEAASTVIIMDKILWFSKCMVKITWIYC